MRVCRIDKATDETGPMCSTKDRLRHAMARQQACLWWAGINAIHKMYGRNRGVTALAVDESKI